MTDQRFTVHAPGRVNLIGDHTDYAGGLALPCAIDLGITLHAERSGTAIMLTSDAFGGNVAINLTDVAEIQTLEPFWGRYVAAVAQECAVTEGFHGSVTSTRASGDVLSSSAAFEIAVALAMGFNG